MHTQSVSRSPWTLFCDLSSTFSAVSIATAPRRRPASCTADTCRPGPRPVWQPMSTGCLQNRHDTGHTGLSSWWPSDRPSDTVNSDNTYDWHVPEDKQICGLFTANFWHWTTRNITQIVLVNNLKQTPLYWLHATHNSGNLTKIQ